MHRYSRKASRDGSPERCTFMWRLSQCYIHGRVRQSILHVQSGCTKWIHFVMMAMYAMKK
jgi:hypothetical protein